MTSTGSQNIAEGDANILIDNITKYSDVDKNVSFEELIHKYNKESSMFNISPIDRRSIDSSLVTVCQDSQMDPACSILSL